MQITAYGKALPYPTKKLLFIMKLMAFLLLAICLQVSAKGTAQTISLNEKKVPLEKVLKTIRKQSGYELFYDETLLKQKGKPVDVLLSNATVEQALTEVFKNQVLTYEINDKVISIKERPIQKKIETPNAPTIIDIKGKVTDESGKAVAGATVRVKGSNKATITNDAGEFELKGVDEKAILVISSINIETKEIAVNGRTEISLVAKPKISQLQDVAVQVQTGYQNLSKASVTGSTVQINNELYNRSMGSNAIMRLQDLVPGLSMTTSTNSLGMPSVSLRVRGENTIGTFTTNEPLIVVDNFPYDGDLNNINPNDVESVSILKDAAAAAIWGAKAGNGVIVITTKKGKLNQRMKMSLSSNYTIVPKPDIYSNKSYLDASSYIDVEKILFDNGYYNPIIANTWSPAITPVVEIFLKEKNGQITSAQAQAMLNEYRGNDVRKDVLDYVYQNPIVQRHSFNINGGSNTSTYYLGLGFDKNPSNLIRNEYDRLSLTTNHTYNPIRNLVINTSLIISNNNISNNNVGETIPGVNNFNQPYNKLVDANGKALSIVRDQRAGYKDSLQKLGFLDWQYRPIDEIYLSDNTSKINSIVFQTSLQYKIINGLNIEVMYRNENQTTQNKNNMSLGRYSTRHLINAFTQYNATMKTFGYPIPVGGILDLSNNKIMSNNLRATSAFNKTIKAYHKVSLFGGAEIREIKTEYYGGSRVYGYNDEYGTSATGLDFATFYVNNGQGSRSIPTLDGAILGSLQRFVSYFVNGSYIYKERYLLTASARKDGANVFGVKANDKFTPLWSVGLGWNASEEKFYKIKWLPYLKARATYGFNGNVYNGAAYLIASYSTSNDGFSGQPYGTIATPPNPSLQWEKVENINLAIDFKAKTIFSGTIEYYQKKGQGLVENVPIAPSTGFVSFIGNAASTRTRGIELTLNASIYNRTNLKWDAQFIFASANSKVTKYDALTTGRDLANSAFGYAFVGNSINGLYSYKFAGVSATGDPLGFIGKTASNNYAAIIGNATIDSVVYHGSATATKFGSLRNTISYKGFNLSFNIAYYLDFYFKRPTTSLNYQELIAGQGHTDYLLRWQKPGDEAFTNVPAITYLTDANRNTFYKNSEIMVEKGDHIRLRDISLGYSYRKGKASRLPFESIDLNVYVNQLGIIWKASKADYDPLYITRKQKPTLSFGIKANF